VSGVHVHQHQALGVLGQDVDAFELRQRVTQRRDIVLTGRQRLALASGSGAKNSR
jgi:hypothetical protein